MDNDESLYGFACRMLASDTLSKEVLEGVIGGEIPSDKFDALSDKELVTFALYFIVTRRSFDGKLLSKKEIMVVKVLQHTFEEMLTTLELKKDVHDLWNTI